jgi:hypothetical protein
LIANLAVDADLTIRIAAAMEARAETAASCEAAIFATRNGALFRGGADRDLAQHFGGGVGNGCPLEEVGVLRRTALAKVKSRKSSRVIRPPSTNSHASGRTMRVSGMSKWPTSELKIALPRRL